MPASTKILVKGCVFIKQPGGESAQHLREFEAQITGIQDEDGASLMQEVRNVGEAGEMRLLVKDYFASLHEDTR